jgi:hypothetical protein
MKVSDLKDGVEQSNIIQAPFTKKYLDSEQEDSGSEVLTIRINKRERELIDYIKQVLHYSQDAKAIKAGLPVMKNVIQNTFGAELLHKLCAENRRRGITDVPKEDSKS